MNIQFLFENEKGSVVDEYGRPEPMDYIVDKEHFCLETLNSHTQYLAQLSLRSERESEAMHMEKDAKPSSDSDQDKVRFFKLLFEKCLSAAAAAKQLRIHARTRQKWAKQYEKDPDGIVFRRKTDRSRILHEGYKSVILDCIDGNPSVVLDN
ncbi:hypothetical protein CU098_006456, partial [Rhizopus stolonifer]